MASDQSVDAGSQPSPQTIGNVFIEQYYSYLLHSPQTVYQFYKENSHLGRLGPNGTMEYVTTIEAINEKILAMDISEFGAEIKTVDAQHSLNGGVVVLVTGYHTGKDSVKKHFTQLFFLAPMDKAGYFVLNDIFRYVDEAHLLEENAGLANGTVTPQTIEQDSAAVHALPVQEQTPPPTLEEEEEDENGEEVYSPPDKETDSVNVEEEVPIAEVIDEVPSVSPVIDEVPSISQVIDEVPSVSPVIDEVPSISEVVVAETSYAATVPVEAPKKSYASIVKVMRENPAPLTVAPPAPVRQVHVRQERRAAPFPAPVPVSDVSTDSSNATESNVVQEAEDGYSVFVKSLPLSATPAQLEEEFKKFGPIKPGGIQVRSHKMQGFCFGFVEFEVASAVHSAIEASPVTIGGRQAFVEEKRTAGTRANNRGRYAPGRGAGFRGDGVRGRGSYGGGRGYGRADYSSRSDFGSRGGGGGGRGGSFSRGTDIGYQRVDHTGSNGGGRGGRSESFGGNSSPKSDPSSARPCLEIGE